MKTLQAKWACWMVFQTSEERNSWLPRYLAIYNGRRCHKPLAGCTPFLQFWLLTATECPSEKTHLALLKNEQTRKFPYDGQYILPFEAMA